jgi:hypothetical protein
MSTISPIDPIEWNPQIVPSEIPYKEDEDDE